MTFTITRRAFLKLAKEAKPDVAAWSYLFSDDYGTPIVGTFHGSDILQVFSGILPNYVSKSFHSYYMPFVYDLDPNSRAKDFMEWPDWGTNQTLMQVFNNRGALLPDDFRQDTYNFVMGNAGSFHI